MELSLFLAKLMGIYMLMIAGFWLICKDRMDKSIREIISSRGLIIFSGVLSIIAGLAIVIGHPVWTFSWVVLITLLGYMMIFKGVARFIVPERIQDRTVRILNSANGYLVISGILIVFGIFLAFHGFMG